MRRIEALLLVLALLATPFAMAAAAQASSGVSCPICGATHHGAGAACDCPMHRKAQLPNAGFAAPLAPAVALAFAQIARPAARRTGWPSQQAAPLDRFGDVPFVPPRS